MALIATIAGGGIREAIPLLEWNAGTVFVVSII